MKLTKRNVKKLLGIRTDADLSRHFGLSRGAAFFWPDNEEIPEAHQLSLMKDRPDVAAMVFNGPQDRAA
jgi:hypothetical protein